MSEELSRVQCVLKSEFNPASLTGSYQPLNGTGFSDTAKILKIYNPSPPLGTLIVDFQTNHYDGPIYGTGTLNIAKGQVLWGKTAANPTFLQIIGYR